MSTTLTRSSSTTSSSTTSSLEAAATRLALLLTAPGGPVGDRADGPGGLEYEPVVELRPLTRTAAPADVWAVDGGQALVADARCLQLLVTRAARVRFQNGSCVLEDEGDLRAHLLGGNDNRMAALALLDGVSPDTSVDINLLRDWWEWDAVALCVEEAEAGAIVLVDGDLQPDWRIESARLGRLLSLAASRGVTLAGITKHS